MSEIAKAHTLTLQFKASQRFPSMLKNTLRALVRSVFDRKVRILLCGRRFSELRMEKELNSAHMIIQEDSQH